MVPLLARITQQHSIIRNIFTKATLALHLMAQLIGMKDNALRNFF
jgi:hypothetical protein